MSCGRPRGLWYQMDRYSSCPGMWAESGRALWASVVLGVLVAPGSKGMVLQRSEGMP